MSAITLITASTWEPVTALEAKTWMRLEETLTDEDTLIEGLIATARQKFEERTNRSVQLKTYDYYPDDAPDDDCPVVIPKAPLVSVTSIRSFQSSELSDSGGTAMSTSGYYVDTAHEFGSVTAVSGFTYPTATRSVNPAIIRFTAGYSSGSSGVPDSVKTEIKQLVAALYEHRGDEAGQAEILRAYMTTPTELDLPTWG